MMSRKRPHPYSDSDEEENPSNASCDQGSSVDEEDDPEEISVSGKLELITLVNFLCHSHLEVPLGPNVNFIIGKNGSGKSAIMTGVVVALGGRALQTSRGLCLKNFVKKGCSYAQVSVKLRNVGSDAFNHSTYGDFITVERKITVDGGSSYKVKSCQGKVISSSRMEIDHIVDHFNIQVDNPVSLLNQDTSRNLLNSKDGSDLYRFFMKATNLEQITSDYYYVVEQKDIALATLQKKEQDIPEVREEVRRREARFIAMKQIRDVKEQIEELKKERVWAEVIENEKDVAKIESSLGRLKSGLPNYDKKIQGCEDKMTEIEEEVRTVEHAITQIKNEAELLQAKQKEVCTQLQEKKKALKEKQSVVRRLQQEIVEETRNQATYQERLEEIMSSVEMEEERQEKNLLLEKRKKDVEKLQADLQDLQKEKNEVQSEKQKYREQLAQLSQEEDSLGKEIKEKKRRVQQAQNQAANRLLKFGDWMPHLVNKINFAVREGKFTYPPKGPIGLHVHLRDQKWSKAIEACLKNLAYGFCVANFEDSKVVKAIIAQTCTRFFPVVLVCSFQETLYDVSSNKPTGEYPTVLDMLDLDDPVISNCLVDQLHIESTLLIESRSQATEVVLSRNAPAKQAFAASGDLIIGGRSAKSIAPPKDWRNYLSSNAFEDERTLVEEINNLNHFKDGYGKKRRELEASLKQKNRELQQNEVNKKQLQDSVNNLKLEIDELMEKLEEEVSPDVSELETDLEHCTQLIADLSEQSESAEEELAEAGKLMAEQEAVNDEHRRRIGEVFRDAEPLKEKLEALIQKNEQKKAEKEHFEKEREKLEQKIDHTEQERDSLIKLAEQKAEKAMQHFDRVETSRTVQDLETEIIKKQKYIDEEERNHQSAEEVTRGYHDILDRFSEIVQNTTNIQKYNKHLNNAMLRRMSYIKEKRKFMASNTSQFFTQHLSQRGFSGHITFDHSQEVLELIVNVHKGPVGEHSERGVNQSTSKMRSLSGGERSVSTICFLTALWGAMESPFRCLDEFDVFMDLWNRKIVTKMVLELAMLPEQRNRQFIFLTPLDLSPTLAQSLHNVKILKLDNPR
ncbi:structural maintenance of chromosomes protein 6-like isoform X1 [Montipora foliosa]|uniref:structural maintenance of chromosomes protein 6-like isoform X1 n=2 Tax=Montipora foliosa TaxID=591990 RepID=UPI0035F1AECB